MWMVHIKSNLNDEHVVATLNSSYIYIPDSLDLMLESLTHLFHVASFEELIENQFVILGKQCDVAQL